MSLYITMIRIMGMLLRGDLIRKKCVKGELFMLIVAGVNIIKEVFNCFRIFQHKKIPRVLLRFHKFSSSPFKQLPLRQTNQKLLI